MRRQAHPMFSVYPACKYRRRKLFLISAELSYPQTVSLQLRSPTISDRFNLLRSPQFMKIKSPTMGGLHLAALLIQMPNSVLPPRQPKPFPPLLLQHRYLQLELFHGNLMIHHQTDQQNQSQKMIGGHQATIIGKPQVHIKQIHN
jgi:hypothetical protein